MATVILSAVVETAQAYNWRANHLATQASALVMALEEALRAARICAALSSCAGRGLTEMPAALAGGLAGVRTHLDRAEALATGSAPGVGSATRPLPARLTEREVAVLRHLAVGRSNREMAVILCRSERTIERHIENIYRKIAARNRADATAFAIRHHLT
jgi:DNA-binding NarL/FixJ family response regulator